MIRLFALMAVTLVALYGLMSVYGAGNPRADNRPDPIAEPQSAAQDAGAQPAIAAPVPETTTDDADQAELVQASTQTPEQVQEFPGPPLRPSPEHEGETPDAPAVAPAGAQGPILYVTGNRVNFRAGPSTNDRVVGALNGGDAVEALGPTDSAWVNIRSTDGTIGYMSGQFLSADPN